MTRSLTLLTVILAFLAGSLTASARIVESEAESEQRYGEPLKPSADKYTPILAGATNRTYFYEGWRIQVAFLNDKAVRMHLQKREWSGAPFIHTNTRPYGNRRLGHGFLEPEMRENA